MPRSQPARAANYRRMLATVRLAANRAARGRWICSRSKGQPCQIVRPAAAAARELGTCRGTAKFCFLKHVAARDYSRGRQWGGAPTARERSPRSPTLSAPPSTSGSQEPKLLNQARPTPSVSNVHTLATARISSARIGTDAGTAAAAPCATRQLRLLRPLPHNRHRHAAAASAGSGPLVLADRRPNYTRSHYGRVSQCLADRCGW